MRGTRLTGEPAGRQMGFTSLSGQLVELRSTCRPASRRVESSMWSAPDRPRHGAPPASVPSRCRRAGPIRNSLRRWPPRLSSRQCRRVAARRRYAPGLRTRERICCIAGWRRLNGLSAAFSWRPARGTRTTFSCWMLWSGLRRPACRPFTRNACPNSCSKLWKRARKRSPSTTRTKASSSRTTPTTGSSRIIPTVTPSSAAATSIIPPRS